MSGLIPQPFIDDLLHRTDLVELIDSYVPLKKAGISFIACCPFHNEKGPSFNVIAKKQFYHCFGCGESGNAISFIMRYLNQGFVDAVSTLASRLGLVVPREGQESAIKQGQNLYELLNKICSWYQKTLKLNAPEAIQYLKDRGLNGKTAALYQLGYAPAGWHTLQTHFRQDVKDLITTGMLIQKDNGETCDRYRHRIMFPIHDRNGRIIGFGGRALDANQKPKYLNSPETPIFQKSRELYGLHQILTKYRKDIGHILVVEGYMDVIMLAQYDIDNAVATLGTATSASHIQLLAKHTKKLTFCFDGDAAGKQAAWRALESSIPCLQTGLDIGFAFLPDGHDPDSLVKEEGKEAFLKRLESSIPLHQFFMETLTKDINLSTAAGKTRIIELAKPYFAKMQESSYREILVDTLSRLTHIENHRLNGLLNHGAIKAAVPKMTSITRTPIRIAIALLLQHPEIFQDCKKYVNLELLDREDTSVLKKIIEYLLISPETTTAKLIELWRDSELFDSMNKLAFWDHQVPEMELTREFIDIVQFLQKQNDDKKIQNLIEKSRKEGLSSPEKILLQNMLKAKHQ